MRDEWCRQRPAPAAEVGDAAWEARIRLVGSALVVLTSRGRGGRTLTIAPKQRAEWFGVCTGQNFKFFGARLHAAVDLDQMLDE